LSRPFFAECDKAKQRALNEKGPSVGSENARGENERIAVLCVGNRLMLDDGLGPAVYDAVREDYDLPDSVDLYDLGCLTLDMLNAVRDYDLIITVDAVDGTDAVPGTVFRYAPDDMARRPAGAQSLHDLRLVDLFDAALLLDYQADGVCLGMQVENPSPAEVTVGLTPAVYDALPLLVETLLAELVRRGVEVRRKDGTLVTGERA
jgi:hydrogenase maturation protease